MGAFWGSLVALAIGLSELFGRRIVGSAGPVTAAWVLQVFGVATSLGSVLFIDSAWRWDDLAWGAVSGLGMAVGLGFYFAALARSASTVVAPTVATLSSVIPYVWTLIRGAEPSTLAVVGAAIAFVGLALVAGGVGEVKLLRAGLAPAIVSGLGYGIGTSVFVEVSDDSGAWAAVSQRGAAMVALGCAALVVGARLLPPRGMTPNAIASGVAGGLTSVFMLIGLSVDAPPTVVMASMFPIVSVAVGFVVYNDPLVRRQVAGIALALAGIAAVVGG